MIASHRLVRLAVIAKCDSERLLSKPARNSCVSASVCRNCVKHRVSVYCVKHSVYTKSAHSLYALSYTSQKHDTNALLLNGYLRRTPLQIRVDRFDSGTRLHTSYCFCLKLQPEPQHVVSALLYKIRTQSAYSFHYNSSANFI